MSQLLKKINLLYGFRFSEQERILKDKLWKILCSDFLQKYISKNDTVLDLAAGYCDFINNIICGAKIAVDINPETKKFAQRDVKVVKAYSIDLPKKLTNTVNVVFAGCFLEHLPSKDAILKTFQEVYRVLKPGGRFIILNPNIRFSTSDYWDYFDHLTPVSDRSVVEGLELAQFKIEKVIARFVPNTVKDHLPKSLFLVKIYLHLPFLFHIFGRQMLVIARK